MDLKRMQSWVDHLRRRAAAGQARLLRLTDERGGGLPAALASAARTFGASHATDGAASMAYYALFAFFPLVLSLLAAGSLVLESERVFQQTVSLVGQLLPESGELIEANLRQVMRLRGSVELVGLAGLLWSGVGIFRVLEDHVNRAWPGAARRGYVRRSALSFAMAGGLAALLLLSVAASGVAKLPFWLLAPWPNSLGFLQTAAWSATSALAPWLLTFLTFFVLYRWLPCAPVTWREATGGAAAAALAWQLAFHGFAWYLTTSLSRYELVYGSLGTVIALLFWIYLSSYITLFGAHLTAALGRQRRN